MLPDTDKDQIVKNAFRGQRHIDDFREIHFEYWQENPDTCVADIVVFHWRHTDDGCRINCVTPMRDRSQMEHWVVFDCGVKARVIAKRPLRPHLAGLNITLQDKVDVRRNSDIDCFATNKLDRLFSKKTRKKNFIKTVWQ